MTYDGAAETNPLYITALYISAPLLSPPPPPPPPRNGCREHPSTAGAWLSPCSLAPRFISRPARDREMIVVVLPPLPPVSLLHDAARLARPVVVNRVQRVQLFRPLKYGFGSRRSRLKSKCSSALGGALGFLDVAGSLGAPPTVGSARIFGSSVEVSGTPARSEILETISPDLVFVISKQPRTLSFSHARDVSFPHIPT